jgi:hypothetical protein
VKRLHPRLLALLLALIREHRSANPGAVFLLGFDGPTDAILHVRESEESNSAVYTIIRGNYVVAAPRLAIRTQWLP